MIRNKLYQYGPEDSEIPAHLHFGKELYDKMVKFKDIIALINSDTDERMTYGELAAQTASVALSLTRMGVKKGDVISVCSDKRFEVMPSVIGALCAGGVYTPIDITYGKYPISHRVKIAQPRIMFCSRAKYETYKTLFDTVGSIEQYIIYDELPKDGVENTQGCGRSTTDGANKHKNFEELKINDTTSNCSLNKNEPIMFSDLIKTKVGLEEFLPVPVNGWVDSSFELFSSGTTGMPKGLLLTHLSVLLNTKCVVDQSFKEHTILNTREWFYTYGLMNTLAALRVGATVVFMPTYTDIKMLEAVQKYKIFLMQTTPSLIVEIVKSPVIDKYDVTSVRYLLSSSSPVFEDLVNAVKAKLPNMIDVLQVYGMSEAGSVCSELRAPRGCKSGSSGIACTGFIIKVVDLNTRQPVGVNQRGEICIKGPCVTTRYVDQELELDEEGFLSTGDVGYYDEDGYFFIVNRIKELIKYNDLSIAPAEFESVLLQHSAVQEAGVVGAPHPRFGEVPVAFVVLRPGASATEQELEEYIDSGVTVDPAVSRRLAGGVRLVDKLPRGAGDKLDREQLKLLLKTNQCTFLNGGS